MVKTDIVGRSYGFLTVLNEHKKSGSITKWKCKCICGNETWVARGKLLSGKTKSCGCKPWLDRRSNNPLHSIYLGMLYRCENPKDSSYRNYGAKGICVCDEWKNDFWTFEKWSMENGWELGLTIDRLDSNGDYCPENCQWITLSENVAKANKEHHRRKTMYTYYGVDPDGNYFEFANASEFGRLHSLNPNYIRDDATGRRNRTKVLHGWKFGFTNNINS